MSPLSDDAVERLKVAARWPQLPPDRYEITGEIGRGGMATVYAAADTALRREVAIKVVNVVAGAASCERLAAESRVPARLEHPGIVPVHDAGRLLDVRCMAATVFAVRRSGRCAMPSTRGRMRPA